MTDHRHEGYVYRYDGKGAHYKCQKCQKEIVLEWIVREEKEEAEQPNKEKKKRGKK